MNPFRYGQVVTHKNFCPRPQLIKTLSGYLEQEAKIVVIGERRTGKTSLIHEAVRRRRGWRLVYAQFWAVKSVTDIADRLLKGIATMESNDSVLAKIAGSLSRLRPTLEVDPFTGRPTFSLSPGMQLPPAGLSAVIDLIERLAERSRLVLALDEFQDIRGVPHSEAVLGELRSRLQQPPGIPCVFAGSIRHQMDEIFRHPRSPFFKSARTIEVAALSRSRFQVFLDARYAAGHRTISPPAWDRIFELAEDNPSDTQQLCAAIWDTSTAGDRIDVDEVTAALRHIFATERKGYESQVRLLTDNQMKSLRALAQIGGAQTQSKRFLEAAGISLPASAKRAVTRLVQLELVYGADKDHKFFDPFFKHWILSEA